VTVHTGQFEIMKSSVARITEDRRLQALLIAFCFGALIEGAAGFGAPVAIAGAFLIGLSTVQGEFNYGRSSSSSTSRS
jgi:L-lactate permease